MPMVQSDTTNNSQSFFPIFADANTKLNTAISSPSSLSPSTASSGYINSNNMDIKLTPIGQLILETTTLASSMIEQFFTPESVSFSPSTSSSASIELSSIPSSAVHLGSQIEIALTPSSSFTSSSSSSFGILTSGDGILPVQDDQSNLRLPFYLRITATTICVILLLIGCPGNALVPYVVLKTKELRNSTNIFLINLSISDILVLIISTPTVLIELHSQPEVWFLGSFVCKAVSFVEIAVAHSSILTILAISFERYYAICRPLQAGYKCTKHRAIIIIVINWIIALLSTLPMLSITQLSTAEFIDGSLVTVCSNSLQQGWHPIYYGVIFVTFFLIPFLILLAIYILIARKLTSDSKSLSNSLNSCSISLRSIKHQSKIRRQVVLMLASVCVTFFICLLPFRVMTLWIIFSTPEEILNIGMDTYYILLFVSRILLYVNSSANPILYNLISSKFRSAFIKVLKIQTSVQFIRRSYDHSVLSDKTSTTYTTNTKNSLKLTKSSSLKNGHTHATGNGGPGVVAVGVAAGGPNGNASSSGVNGNAVGVAIGVAGLPGGVGHGHPNGHSPHGQGQNETNIIINHANANNQHGHNNFMIHQQSHPPHSHLHHHQHQNHNNLTSEKHMSHSQIINSHINNNHTHHPYGHHHHHHHVNVIASPYPAASILLHESSSNAKTANSTASPVDVPSTKGVVSTFVPVVIKATQTPIA